MAKRLGIAFTGGEGPDPEQIRRVLGEGDRGLGYEVRGLYPLLVAADSGLMLAEAAGLRPHWIIGDMDSLDNERLNAYPPECVIRHAADKDFTDTELALSLLREKGCDETWVIGGGGGRIDHLFGIRELFEGGHYPVRWITAAEDIYCIDSGGSAGSSLTFGLEQGSVVSVLILGAGPWKAQSSGLKWPLLPVSWKRGMTGISNIAVDTKIEIKAEQGRFMVVLEDAWRQL